MKKTVLLLVMFFLAGCNPHKQEDPLVGHWIELMPVNKHIVQGISLYPDGTAASIGMATLSNEKRTRNDKQLILEGKSIGNGQTIAFSETFDIVSVSADTLQLGKFGQYCADYYRVGERPDLKDAASLPNLLQKFEGCGDLQKRVFTGTLPAASCPGIVYQITLYNYKNSGDGVFNAKLTYLEAENGKDTSFEFNGRQYTLKGTPEDKNATVLQFVPFNNKSDTMNFLYQEQKLIMLDKNMNKIQSSLNYSLTETK